MRQSLCLVKKLLNLGEIINIYDTGVKKILNFEQ